MVTKKQHILPCSYLQWFSIDENLGRESKVSVYNIKGSLFQNNITINSTAYSTNFYDIEWSDSVDKKRVEDFMWSSIEWWINKIINKIDKKEIITDDEVETLGIFIGFQALRWPNHKKTYNKLITWIEKEKLQAKFPDQETIEKSTQEYKKYSWKDIDPKIISNFLSHENSDFTLENQNWYLKFLGDSFKEIAEKICSKKWLIYNSPEWEVLTGDEPVSCIWRDGNNKLLEIWVYNWFIWFPLSKNSYLFCIWEHHHRKDSAQSRIIYFEDSNLSKSINHSSIVNATHRIIWKDQATIEKFKNYNPKIIGYSNLKLIELVVEKFQSCNI